MTLGKDEYILYISPLTKIGKRLMNKFLRESKMNSCATGTINQRQICNYLLQNSPLIGWSSP